MKFPCRQIAKIPSVGRFPGLGSQCDFGAFGNRPTAASGGAVYAVPVSPALLAGNALSFLSLRYFQSKKWHFKLRFLIADAVGQTQDLCFKIYWLLFFAGYLFVIFYQIFVLSQYAADLSLYLCCRYPPLHTPFFPHSFCFLCRFLL